MKVNSKDGYIIWVIPILLGDGKRLFKGRITEIEIQLVVSKSLDTSLIQLHYKKE